MGGPKVLAKEKKLEKRVQKIKLVPPPAPVTRKRVQKTKLVPPPAPVTRKKPRPMPKVKPARRPCPMGNPNCMCPGTNKQCPKMKTRRQGYGPNCFKYACRCNLCAA